MKPRVIPNLPGYQDVYLRDLPPLEAENRPAFQAVFHDIRSEGYRSRVVLFDEEVPLVGISDVGRKLIFDFADEVVHYSDSACTITTLKSKYDRVGKTVPFKPTLIEKLRAGYKRLHHWFTSDDLPWTATPAQQAETMRLEDEEERKAAPAVPDEDTMMRDFEAAGFELKSRIHLGADAVQLHSTQFERSLLGSAVTIVVGGVGSTMQASLVDAHRNLRLLTELDKKRFTDAPAPVSLPAPETVADGVAERVHKIIEEHLGVEKSAVVEGARFEDLGADSLDLVELVMAFEEEFDVEVPDDAAEGIETVGEAIAAVKRLTASAGR